MRLKRYSGILKPLLIALFSIGLFLILINSKQFEHQSLAFETECPSSMDPNSSECLSFLQQQQQLIADEKDRLSNSITAEQLEQLSLYEQINYLNDRIQENELTISEIEIEIEKKNVEVNILNADIIDLEKSVDTIKQEINVLESSVHERTQISYKLSQISPLEVFMDSGDLENLFRKIKYLLEIKKQDHKYLADMTVTHESLKAEEDLLKDKKEEVESMREDIETEYSELAEVKESLESQRVQQQALAAESESREQEMAILRNEMAQKQAQIDAEIIAYIQRTQQVVNITDGTYVPAGTPIGKMGNTGYSFGAHLHFMMNDGYINPAYKELGRWWGTIDPWQYIQKGPDYFIGDYGYIHYYVHPGAWPVPVGGRAYRTQDYHQGLSIDLSSNYGATIYSVMPGYLHSGTDQYGGKFVKIYHDNGWMSGYLHLQ